MNLDHSASHRLICGTSGMGKSTLFLDHIRRTKGRLFIFDYKTEYQIRTGVQPCRDPAQLDAALAGRGNVVFNPLQMFPGRLTEGFDFFATLVWRVASHNEGKTFKGRKCFVCDELQFFAGERRLPTEVCAIWESGRCYELDTLTLAQSCNLVDRRIRGQITDLYVFSQVDRNALNFLLEFGFDGQAIGQLKKYDYLHRARGDEALTAKAGRTKKIV